MSKPLGAAKPPAATSVPAPTFKVSQLSSLTLSKDVLEQFGPNQPLLTAFVGLIQDVPIGELVALAKTHPGQHRTQKHAAELKHAGILLAHLSTHTTISVTVRSTGETGEQVRARYEGSYAHKMAQLKEDARKGQVWIIDGHTRLDLLVGDEYLAHAFGGVVNVILHWSGNTSSAHAQLNSFDHRLSVKTRFDEAFATVCAASDATNNKAIKDSSINPQTLLKALKYCAAIERVGGLQMSAPIRLPLPIKLFASTHPLHAIENRGVLDTGFNNALILFYATQTEAFCQAVVAAGDHDFFTRDHFLVAAFILFFKRDAQLAANFVAASTPFFLDKTAFQTSPTIAVKKRGSKKSVACVQVPVALRHYTEDLRVHKDKLKEKYSPAIAFANYRLQLFLTVFHCYIAGEATPIDLHDFKVSASVYHHFSNTPTHDWAI